jgi:hypothetical protein
MRVPIRMIGIATTFFWIFLIAFFVSAVYSVKDVHFDFGEPQTSLTADNEMIFSLPVSITNKGFYNIGSFNISTEILDKEGFTITRGSTFVPVINKNDMVTITHNMTIDVNDLLQQDKNYLFNDTELKIYEAVGMRIADAIPVQASTNFSMPWGAPLYNFSLGEPAYATYNLTHFRITVPISFENHAFFDLVCDMRIRMYNSTGALVSKAKTSLEAYANSPYNGFIEFYVPMTEMTPTGRFKVYFSTPIFDYGPLVIPYG